MKKIYILLIVTCIISFTSCSGKYKKAPEDSSSSANVSSESGPAESTSTEHKFEDDKNRKDSNGNTGIIVEDDIPVFVTDEYLKNVSEYVISIDECKAKMQEDFEKIKKVNDMSGIDFSKCILKDFPDVSDINVLIPEEDDISVDDAISVFENDIKEKNLEEYVNIEEELYDASNQLFEYFQSIDYVDDHHPLVYEFKDKMTTGRGFYIHNRDYSLQMCNYGIYSYSDGVFNRTRGYAKESAISDWLGGNFEGKIETGSYDTLKDSSNKLLDGEKTVGEVGENVIRYFLSGTPRKPMDNIGLNITNTSVYKLNDDIYAYGYDLVRTYNGIPFAAGSYGSQTNYEDYEVNGDVKTAYTAQSNTVNAFVGFCEAQKFKETLEPQNKLLSLWDAYCEFHAKMGAEIRVDIDTIDFEYVPIIKNPDAMDVDQVTVIYPCWAFVGRNGRTFQFFVDALTGDVYYTAISKL